ncbi:hypothetical protein V6N12_050418 [Hibiscus sabdariffa]|uniref:Uncharacterized protein n=1 Tax=Hibiscus sabdariffa TaxID=183260 RepID=A0ABR2GCM9_9ROSI
MSSICFLNLSLSALGALADGSSGTSSSMTYSFLSCLRTILKLLATMNSELQKQHENMVAYEMIQNLKEIYEGQARQERYETSKALFQCKMIEGSPVGAHVIKMMGYIQTLEKLGFSLKDELAIDLILQSLPDSFKPLVLNFNMNEINKILP